MTLEFTGTQRFEIVRVLGRGGMGIVFEAFDRDQGAACALKLLPRTTPGALLRFKREFRAVQGLSHPNLITLGELVNEGEHWFFTMELVDGVDFLTWVQGDRGETVAAPRTVTLTLQDAVPLGPSPGPGRPPQSSFDEARLRDALRQLVEGLRFLHDAGKVHRDVKPSNVLVTPAGRVVILDFGLVSDLGNPGAGSDDRRPRTATGTPGYMAPEHVLDGAVGSSADLYAVGAVLFRALTGTLPSIDSSIRSALLGGAIPPPRPGALVSGVPRLLDDLCAELLAPVPGARPSAREVLARLGATEGPDGPGPSAPFVGRREEIARLLSAHEGSSHRSVVVVLDGPSGIGKTALLEELVARLRARDDHPLVLSGRCYEHEGIPYKAIDGVMDALGDALASAPEEVIRALPANAPLLGVLFPALRRVPALAPGDLSPAEPMSASQAYEMRRGAERAGRQLFGALAAWRPLVVAIDDFQWSDPDSLTFLAALTAPPDPPPFLLLLSTRTPQALPFGDGVRRLSLAPLPPADARALAAGLLRTASGSATTSAEVIAAESGGNPFFVGELAWRAVDPARAGSQARLEDALWDRISACQGDARTVLELVALAAAPIGQRVVAEAAGLDAGTFSRAAQELRTKRLVRTTGLLPDDKVEARHDRIRETVVARLAQPAKTAQHRRLAEVLERLRPDDPDALVTHFEGAGDGARAAAYALRAGDQAARALAFERAAAFYRQALSGLSAAVAEHEGLREKLADALANAGLGADAAVEYERAAEEAEPAHARELHRRAAENLLRSGRVDEGLTVLGGILERMRVRMPRTPGQAFASLLLRRARVRLRGLAFRERLPEQIAESELVRADTLWAVAARLGPIDTIRAADFQARHLLLCLKLGEPFRIARALLAEAAFVAIGGPGRARQMEKILARARPVVGRIQHPYATAMLQFTEGFADYQFGRYARALEGLSRASELFRTTCTGASHDVAVCDRFALDSLFNLGELAEVSRRVPLLLDDAERRGDLYLAAELRTGLPNIAWLCGDRPDEAHRSNELGIAPWSRRSFYLQHYYHSLAAAHIALYTGDGEAAFRTVEKGWRSLRASLLLKVQAVRTEALYLRARAAIAHGDPEALRIAEQAAVRLSREAVPAATGLAAAARAGLAARRGDGDGALALLRTAERALATAGVRMCAAACRFHLGRLARDPGSVGLLTEAGTWMRDRGIVRPDRFAELLVPLAAPREARCAATSATAS